MNYIKFLPLLLLIVGCARMGQPDGGWYDETPPHVIGANPADRATGAKAQKISILFDEFIKIENATEKVVVSPPQLEQPEIKASGKRIEVKLNDSLRANTTYTIDFSDAITDNNEGNPLGNYTYSFSTGPDIDTLEVAGTVLTADNLEPVKGILVGLYADRADSAFISQPMLRVARTDSRGRFIIRGVAPGEYRIYGLADADGNYRFSQKSEQIAFCSDIISPSVVDDTRQDTLWTDSLHIKSVERVKYRHFLPDNVTLMAFTETLTDRQFLKSERTEADNFKLYFTYGDGSLPRVRGLDFDSSDPNALLVEPSLRADTVTYWLRDTALVNRDTLNIELTYMACDTTGTLVENVDTLQLLAKTPLAKRLKQQKKEYDEWEKKQEKKRRRGDPYDSIMPPKALQLEVGAPNTLDPDRNITFKSRTPLASIDTSLIHLYARHDTLWYEARYQIEPWRDPRSADSTLAAHALPDSTLAYHRNYILRGEWRPDIEYSLEIDSTAFTDIYGTTSKKIKSGFKVPSLDTYGTLILNISGLKSAHAVVQLLDQSDKVVKETTLQPDGTAQFFYLKGANYYVRLFEDDNNNGLWDTGDYASGRQPERTYYYPQKIECKAKWDITRDWNVTSTPPYEQKPAEITKQKADKQKTIKQRNLQRARQLGIELPSKF